MTDRGIDPRAKTIGVVGRLSPESTVTYTDWQHTGAWHGIADLVARRPTRRSWRWPALGSARRGPSAAHVPE
jgi:hypothetical protein